MVRAQSISDAKIKRDSSVLRTTTEMMVRFFEDSDAPCSQSGSESCQFASLAGSGTCERFRFSGRMKTTSSPKGLSQMLKVTGTKRLIPLSIR